MRSCSSQNNSPIHPVTRTQCPIYLLTHRVYLSSLANEASSNPLIPPLAIINVLDSFHHSPVCVCRNDYLQLFDLCPYLLWHNTYTVAVVTFAYVALFKSTQMLSPPNIYHPHTPKYLTIHQIDSP